MLLSDSSPRCGSSLVKQALGLIEKIGEKLLNKLSILTLLLISGCATTSTIQKTENNQKQDDLVNCYTILDREEIQVAVKQTVSQKRNALFYLYAGWAIDSESQFVRISNDSRFKSEFRKHDCFLVDVTADSYLAEYLRLFGPPTFLYYRAGERVNNKLVGIVETEKFYNWLASVRKP